MRSGATVRGPARFTAPTAMGGSGCGQGAARGRLAATDPGTGI